MFQNVSTIFLLILLAYPATGRPLAAGIRTESLRIVIIDGNTVVYKAHKPKTNAQVLMEILPGLFPDRQVVSTYVPINDHPNLSLIDADTVMPFKPELVLVHWSAFAQNGKFCGLPADEFTKVAQTRPPGCASELLKLMITVHETLGAKFIVYSRRPDLCKETFGRAIYDMLPNAQRDFADSVGLMSMNLHSSRKANFMERKSKVDLKDLSRRLFGQRNSLRVDKNDGLCLLSTR